MKYWYRETNKLCLIIPLNLGVENNDPIALILEECDDNYFKGYKAKTILELRDAYRGARLVQTQISDWLNWR